MTRDTLAGPNDTTRSPPNTGTSSLKLYFLLLLSALATPSFGSEILTVGPPGSNSDFPSIQPAIDAAGSGDLILVRRQASPNYVYPAFTITDKSVSVRVVAGHQVQVRGALIQGLALGDTVALTGLRFRLDDSSVRVLDCRGAVRLESCRFSHGSHTPSLEARSALDLSLHDCDILGSYNAPGISLELSRVGVYASTINGGMGLTDSPLSGSSVGGVGPPAILVGVRSFLWLGDCQVVGGQGGHAYCSAHGWCDSFEPGEGGPALMTHPSSRVLRVATDLAGGIGGYADDHTQGATGPTEIGTSQMVPGDQRRLDAPSSLRNGEQAVIKITGVPGESVDLYVASDGWHRFLGWQWGIWFQRTLVGQNPTSLGVIPTSGTLEASISLPALGGSSSETYALQAICKTSPTRFRTTPVRMITAVDAEAPSMESEVIHVDNRAAPGGNGRSWGRAFSSLEHALAASPFDADGRSEIWLAEGRYTPADPGGDVNSRFRLPGGIKLMGGFRGDESSASERILGMHESILDGDLNGDDIPYTFGTSSGRADNARVVLEIEVPWYYYGPMPITTLERLTVRGAEATLDYESAITVRGDVRVQLFDCDLRENSTSDDGGALRHRDQNSDAALEMSRCRVRFNRANGKAGGVYWTSRETSSFKNCAFYGNTAGWFPALVVRAARNGRPPTRIVSSTFAGNSGVGCPVDGLYTHLGSLDVINCILWGIGAPNSPVCPNEIECDRVHYSTIESPNPNCSLGTNGTLDPMFVNLFGADGICGTDDDDLRLSPGSPCIDAGTPVGLGGALPLDLNGLPRFVDDPNTPDTGIGGTRVVDQGAFEFQ